MKNFFVYFNKIIQWTKQWHFFHVCCAGSLAIILTIMILLNIISLINEHRLLDDLNFVLAFGLLISADMCFLKIPLLILSLSLMILNYFKYKNCKVINEFLLNNKIYNIFFIISLIFYLYIDFIYIKTFIF